VHRVKKAKNSIKPVLKNAGTIALKIDNSESSTIRAENHEWYKPLSAEWAETGEKTIALLAQEDAAQGKGKARETEQDSFSPAGKALLAAVCVAERAPVVYSHPLFFIAACELAKLAEYERRSRA